VPFQLLSVAMGFTLPVATATSLLVAQNRLRLNMLLTVGQAVIFLVFVLAGALGGSIIWVAAFVGLFNAILGPLTVALPAWRGGRATVAFVARIYRFPVLASAAAYGAGWAATYLLKMEGDVAVVSIRTGIWVAVFGSALLILKPATAVELLPRIAVMLQRFGIRKKAVAGGS